MRTLNDWIEEWKKQYAEDTDKYVMKADIKIILMSANGEIDIRDSEYRSRDAENLLNKVKIVPGCTDITRPIVCG